ncbi:MAG: hypothetical protein WAT79_07940 [Saprospiraceae bacterium]
MVISLFSLMITLFTYSCVKNDSSGILVEKQQGIESATISSRSIEYPENDYKIWEIDSTPYTVIFPLNGQDSSQFWIVLRDTINNGETILTVNNGNLGFFDTYLKLSNSTYEFVYLLLGSTYSNFTPNAGGLSLLIDQNLLSSIRSMTETTKPGIIDDVSEKAECKKNGTSADPCKCSGGHGATACECTKSIAGISWHEAVTCGAGYFACCPGN